MSGIIGQTNLKVAILDSDYYALQSINSYLAWDRRTRVTLMTQDSHILWDYLRTTVKAELPDVVVLDANHVSETLGIDGMIQRIHEFVSDALVICIAQSVDEGLIEAVARGGAKAFLLKHEARLHIAWAIIFSLKQPFTITPGVMPYIRNTQLSLLHQATVLPNKRDYPEMTDRVRQAIQLCVIEGMPAHLAADEMAISLHTIRGYIKEGYRILEAYDHYEYPNDMTPQERAFMRFTALDDNYDLG